GSSHPPTTSTGPVSSKCLVMAVSFPACHSLVVHPVRPPTVEDLHTLQRSVARSNAVIGANVIRDGALRFCRDRRGPPVGRSLATPLRSLVPVSDKSERRAARSVVAQYHQTELESLVAHVAEAVDRYRGGQ